MGVGTGRVEGERRERGGYIEGGLRRRERREEG